MTFPPIPHLAVLVRTVNALILTEYTHFSMTHILTMFSIHNGLECVENTYQTFHMRLIMRKSFIYTILLMHINETIRTRLIGCLTKCHVHDLSVYDM